MPRLLVLALVCAHANVTAAPAAPAAPAATVVVFMDRNGMLDASGVRVIVPAYRGDRMSWRSVVSCVRGHFAPFAIDIVDTPPAGTHLRLVVGGLPSHVGDERKLLGLAPSSHTRISRGATGHVFSEGIELQIATLCNTAAHEIGHMLGLEHVIRCDDIMNAGSDCSPQRFVDASSTCGEFLRSRTCKSGRETQNSFLHLVAWLGLRRTSVPVDPYAVPSPIDPYGPVPVNPYPPVRQVVDEESPPRTHRKRP